jgi:hypothetical protein
MSVYATPTSLNNIIQVFAEFAAKHDMINSFGYGPLFDLGVDKAPVYPLMWIEPQPGIVHDHTVDLKYNIYFLDLVQKGAENRNDVHSDTFQFALDLRTFIQKNLIWDTITINTDSAIESYWEKFDDELDGHKFTINLQMEWDADACTIPGLDLSGATFSIGEGFFNVAFPQYLLLTGGVLTGGLTGTTAYFNSISGDTIYLSGVSLTDEFIQIGYAISSASTIVQNGVNTYTGGTPQFPSVNVIANPTFSSVTTTVMSATTYLNLPTDFDHDIFVTGGTRNDSLHTYTFTNNTGGTFSVIGLTDITITGGTYNNGVITFTNNTGGTFTTSGFYTNANDIYVTGGTANNISGNAVFTNNTGGTFTVGGFFQTGNDKYVTGLSFNNNILTVQQANVSPNLSVLIDNLTGLTINGNITLLGSAEILGNVSIVGTATTFNTQTLQAEDNNIHLNYLGTHITAIGGGLVLLSGVSNSQDSSILSDANGNWITNTGYYAPVISGQTYYGLPLDIRITGGTSNNSLHTYTFTNNTGGTFSVVGLTDIVVTGASYSNSTGVTTFTNNTGGTFTASGYYTGYTTPLDIRVTGGTLSNGTATFTNNTGGTFNVTGFGTLDTFVTGFTNNNNLFTISNSTGGTVSTLFNTISGLTINGGLSSTTINTNIITANTITSNNTIVGRSASATGGAITYSNGYTIHTFTTTGSTTFTVPTGGLNIDYLVVAGGGGGACEVYGGCGGGGGGAGGMLTGSTSLVASVITITVGAGGGGGTGTSSNASNSGTSGNNSSLAYVAIAIGGGGGGAQPNQPKGGNGGSGGGAALDTSAGGTGTAGQGNNGGSTSGGHDGGAGGGGAGQVGANNSAESGANGGNGLSSSINFTATTYAGGGGGGGYKTAGGGGGTGGGGNGGNASVGSNGTANTGGGGGGGGGVGAYGNAGGTGGSGIVIIRYVTPTASSLLSINSNTTVNGNLTVTGTTTTSVLSATTYYNLPGIGNYNHYITTPTNGQTVNLTGNSYNIINPAGTIAGVTVNLPSQPNNNDACYIKFTQIITTVTYANGSVQDSLGTSAVGSLLVLVYDTGTSKWY